jgi:hypothetical protein
MNLGMYIMASESISATYFINLAHQSVRLQLHPPVVDSQLVENITTATNTHATIEELLDACFLCGPCHIKGKKAFSSSQNFLFNNLDIRN